MKRIAASLLAILALLVSAPAFAQHSSSAGGNVRTVTTESWVEQWDPRSQSWVRIADDAADQAANTASLPTMTTTYVNGRMQQGTRGAARYAQPNPRVAPPTMHAQYGPFMVTSASSAAMIDATDAASPAYFDAMLRDFPEIAVLEMINAPGTSHDIANLAVGRRIRAAGIATHVPQGGSVRSGAVELFLAGSMRTMEEGAQFAVHSWLDNHGREADDFATDHPAHRLYLDYYVEMGMSEQQARGFYAMTNSVPHHSALWLRASDMQPWLRSAPVRSRVVPVLALTQAHNLNLEIVPQLKAVLPVLEYRDLSSVSIAQLDVSLLDSKVAFP